MKRKETSHKETFIVEVLNTQHASWQGTVTWTEQKRTEHFRSALELINLIDDALQTDEPGNHKE